MIKGGYKIVNFNGTALSGTAVTLSGIYDQIVDDYNKPVMVSGVSLNGAIMDDAYAGVQEKTGEDTSKYVELTVYGGVITVTDDDEVSFAVSKTIAELVTNLTTTKLLLDSASGTGTKTLTDNYKNYRYIIIVGFISSDIYTAIIHSPHLLNAGYNLSVSAGESGLFKVKFTNETTVNVLSNPETIRIYGIEKNL